MESRTFFNLPDGTEARLYSLRNRSGFGADITDWGGAIVRLLTPDRDGKLTDVVLGFAEPSEYIENGPFFGALIGRVANRIAGGKFELDGRHYQLECNDTDRPNTLHGGQSYGRRQWQAAIVDDATLELTLTSPDGDAGFPGKVEVKVTYHVGEDNSLSIDYRAETDKVTVVSMTNHAYFNLNGEGSGSCAGHTIRIAADRPAGCPPCAFFRPKPHDCAKKILTLSIKAIRTCQTTDSKSPSDIPSSDSAAPATPLSQCG